MAAHMTPPEGETFNVVGMFGLPLSEQVSIVERNIQSSAPP